MKNKTAYFGVYIALALILSYVEALIPISFGVPGVKIGLANLIIVIVLYKSKSVADAFIISIIRIILSGFMFGNMFAIIYSLAGGILSLLVMIFLKNKGSFSLVGVSIAGGVFHNIGQLIVAMIVVETYKISFYLPVLLITGLITGALIGIIAGEVLKRIKNIPHMD